MLLSIMPIREDGEMRLILECNSVACQHRWQADINPERIHDNRVVGLMFCPKCGRYDAPYIVKEEE